MADEIKEKIGDMDAKYQELVSQQQTLMTTDNPSRPGTVMRPMPVFSFACWAAMGTLSYLAGTQKTSWPSSTSSALRRMC